MEEEEKTVVIPRPKWINYDEDEFTDLTDTERLDVVLYHLSEEEWISCEELQDKLFGKTCLKYSILRILENTLDEIIIKHKNGGNPKYKLSREVDLKNNRGLGEILNGVNNNHRYNCLECRRHPFNAY